MDAQNYKKIFSKFLKIQKKIVNPQKFNFCFIKEKILVEKKV